MVLPASQMPCSFVGYGLLLGAKSEILNPPNEGQGWDQILIGKPIRCLARLVYQIAVTILSPIGLIYHTFKALGKTVTWIVEKDPNAKMIEKTLMKENFRAAGIDLFTSLSWLFPVIPFVTTPFLYLPDSSVSFWLSSGKVTSDSLPGKECSFDNLVLQSLHLRNWVKHYPCANSNGVTKASLAKLCS